MNIYDLGSKRSTKPGVRDIELRRPKAYVDRPVQPVDASFVYVDGSEQKGRQVMTKDEFLQQAWPGETPRRRFDKEGFLKRTVQGVIVLAGGLAGWMVAQQADAVMFVGVAALIIFAFSNIYFNRER